MSNKNSVNWKTNCVSSENAFEYCSNYGIQTLYHITRMGNIPSVLKRGLLSHNRIRKEEIRVFSSSNQEIQESRSQIEVGDLKGNDFVPLFFSNKTPFLYRIEMTPENEDIAMVYVCIKPEILGEKGVYFSDGNIACTKTTKTYSNLDDLSKLDWKNIWNFNPDGIGWDEAKRVRSAEVLIPHRIAPEWFQKLIVPDEQAKQTLLRNIQLSIPIEVNRDFYYTDRGKKRE
jgi:hypothetical protein